MFWRPALPLDQAQALPLWRRPITLLILSAIAMPLAFNTWSALINNFVIEAAGFTGVEIGWLHSVREIPGFLAVGVIFIIIFMREQILGMVSLIMLGVATAITAEFPTFGGILIVTMVSSIGFHYYETVNQSLQLQWLPKNRAPQVIGNLMAVGSAATLVAYVAIVMTWKTFDLSFGVVFGLAGGGAALIAFYCLLAIPQFDAPHPQRKSMVLRRRYWLFYALEFMSGARRQIFVVFAGFMMVERFGFDVHEITALYLINLVANMIFAPMAGHAVGRFGERNVLCIEYAGLMAVFLAYSGIYFLGWGLWIAAALYVLDHFFFALALGRKTYFQKIADPSDIAPTAAVSFTINHIAAVFLPVGLGYLWIQSPGAVFILAALMAFASLVLSALIPRHPEAGHETIIAGANRAAAE